MKKNKRQLRMASKAVMMVLLLSLIGVMKGYSVEIGNLKYSLNSNTLKATVIGHKNGTSATGSLIIPESVTYEGVTYCVDYIKNYAFQGCNNLTGSLVIPNSVTYVSESAFYGCSGFNGSLVIGNSVVSIGARAFYGCSGFTEIVSKKGPYVPSASSNSFSGMNFNIPVYVLEGCASSYQSSTGWNQFTNYHESLFFYDFSSIAPSGQTLYYQIIDEANHYVELCHPNSSMDYPWNGYEMPTGEIVIPTTVSNNGVTYSVTSIGKWAFKDCHDITGTLNLPSTITKIEGGAFYGCTGLTGSLVFPDSLTSIGGSAFQGCSGLTGELVLPNLISVINGLTFSGCAGLTGSLSFPSSVSTIQALAFENCTGFNGELTIGNTVTTIGYSAFKGCTGFTAVHYNMIDCTNTTSFYQNPPFQNCGGTIEIGESVERIPDYMFCRANFTGGLLIPSSVTEVGNFAFSRCSGLSGNLIIPSTVLSIGHSAFSGCSGFNGQLVIPNTWATIAGSAFSGCSGLCGNLVIPNTITSIGTNAFSGCSGFTGTLSIPNSVTTIDYGAFMACSGFSGISIPNAISAINEATFMGCNGITSLVIPNSVTKIGTEAFENCTNLTSITIPNSVVSIGWFAFDNTGWYNNQPDGVLYLDGWCLGYKGAEMNPVIEIEEGTIHIADGAFMNNRGLFSVTMPNSVMSIGNLSFEMCENLTSIILSNSLTSIGNNAFSYCPSLHELKLPDSLITIGDGAFMGSSLSHVIIPNSVTTVGANAFGGSYMVSITLGSSVSIIGDGAFNQCEGLRTIVSLSPVPPAVGEYAFNMEGMYNNTLTVYVPESAISDYQNAPAWGEVANILPIMQIDGFDFTYNSMEQNAIVIGYHGESEELIIPSSVFCNGNTYAVTSIGDWAFYDNLNIKSVSIPNSIVAIGSGAFYCCYNLEGELIIPNSVVTIGNSAFCYCNKLQSVIIGNSVTSIGVSAFISCQNLSTLVIGNSVTAIESRAFDYCSNLSEIWVRSEIPPTTSSWGTFYGVKRTIPVYVPCGSQTEFESAYEWSAFSNYHEIPYYLVVKSSSALLGEASVIQYGDCENNESIVHAEPRLGATFAGWTVNGELVLMEMDYSFPLNEDIILTANFESSPNHHVFVGGTNLWSDPSNWEPNEVPDETSTVGIWTNVEVDENVCVNSLVIYGDNTVSILPNHSLTVTDTLVTPNASSLVVKEGGELFHSCDGVLATVEKSVRSYTEGEQGGWNLIAMPLAGSYEISATGNLTNDEYDLYYYDEPTASWINQKETDTDFHQLEAGKGYLYANKGEMRMRYGFEDGLEGWTTISPDGNGSSWHHVSNAFGSHSGEGHISSAIAYYYVYDNYYSDDDYIVSPMVQFTSASTISFWVYTADWIYEHFAVAISTSGNTDASDFTTIQEFVPFEKSKADGDSLRGVGNWRQYSVDLSQYAGQEGYIAIHHYECTDMQHTLRIDDIELGGMGNLRNAVGISFIGELENGSVSVSLPLSYTADNELPGFNLVGNPFPCRAYINRDYYVMNEDGTGINPVAVPKEMAIPPCMGVFVKAEGEGETVVFTRVAQ